MTIELAALEWIDRTDRHRLRGSIGNIPPTEIEVVHDVSMEEPAELVLSLERNGLQSAEAAAS